MLQNWQTSEIPRSRARKLQLVQSLQPSNMLAWLGGKRKLLERSKSRLPCRADTRPDTRAHAKRKQPDSSPRAGPRNIRPRRDINTSAASHDILICTGGALLDTDSKTDLGMSSAHAVAAESEQQLEQPEATNCSRHAETLEPHEPPTTATSDSRSLPREPRSHVPSTQLHAATSLDLMLLTGATPSKGC